MMGMQLPDLFSGDDQLKSHHDMNYFEIHNGIPQSLLAIAKKASNRAKPFPHSPHFITSLSPNHLTVHSIGFWWLHQTTKNNHSLYKHVQLQPSSSAN
jgi:hypothetical protein